MREREVLPYGEWPSPISASAAAGSVAAPGFPTVHRGELWWNQVVPEEDGRSAVLRRRADGEVEVVLPAPWNARTRVHEYGGRAWVPLPDGSLVFASWADHRLYLLTPGGEPAPLTPEPASPAALRYAAPVATTSPARDPGAVPDEVLCVRETHAENGSITRHVVAVPLDGSGADDPAAVREVVGGSHFLAHPRVSPDGRRIAWIAWEHPQMPWDGTELRVADLVDGVAVAPLTLLGGPAESVLQPEWADDSHVYVVTDRSGWWNLHRVDIDAQVGSPDAVTALCPRAEEFAFPLWLLGFCSYAVLADGRIATLHGSGTYSLGLLDPATGALTDVVDDSGTALPFPFWHPYLHAEGTRIAGVAASPTLAPSVVCIDAGSGAMAMVESACALPASAYLPEVRLESYPGPDGHDVHAKVWAPRNPAARAPEGELPPYVVFVHGGPTSEARVEVDLEIAWFTSRGIGVIDVDYGGSAGYGRAYRELLKGQWGVVDVADSVAAVQALCDRGDADPARLAIRGGSAGGWTALSALTDTDVFAAGTSYYGVAELVTLAEDTHDFESRYLDGLIGPLPEARHLYDQRAPLNKIDQLSCPVLLLQGADDQVVPVSQALMFRDALAAKGIAHAYLEFADEQHGFRRESSIVASLEAELSFYGQVLGFTPPGVPRLALDRTGPRRPDR